ncbi:MAG TPA: ATP synthase subunit I [Bacillota bacterium]|nr:ATP synthase subunit I [Bacillota bacterium]
MESFYLSMKKVARLTCYITAIAVLAWLVLASHRVFTQGFLLGIFISACNGVILLIKTKQIGEMTVDPSKRVRGTGMLQRMLLGGFAVYMADRLPHIFSVLGVVSGLFVVQILALIVTVTHSKY